MAQVMHDKTPWLADYRFRTGVRKEEAMDSVAKPDDEDVGAEMFEENCTKMVGEEAANGPAGVEESQGCAIEEEVAEPAVVCSDLDSAGEALSTEPSMTVARKAPSVASTTTATSRLGPRRLGAAVNLCAPSAASESERSDDDAEAELVGTPHEKKGRRSKVEAMIESAAKVETQARKNLTPHVMWEKKMRARDQTNLIDRLANWGRKLSRVLNNEACADASARLFELCQKLNDQKGLLETARNEPAKLVAANMSPRWVQLLQSFPATLVGHILTSMAFALIEKNKVDLVVQLAAIDKAAMTANVGFICAKLSECSSSTQTVRELAVTVQAKIIMGMADSLLVDSTRESFIDLMGQAYAAMGSKYPVWTTIETSPLISGLQNDIAQPLYAKHTAMDLSALKTFAALLKAEGNAERIVGPLRREAQVLCHNFEHLSLRLRTHSHANLHSNRAGPNHARAAWSIISKLWPGGAPLEESMGSKVTDVSEKMNVVNGFLKKAHADSEAAAEEGGATKQAALLYNRGVDLLSEHMEAIEQFATLVCSMEDLAADDRTTVADAMAFFLDSVSRLCMLVLKAYDYFADACTTILVNVNASQEELGEALENVVWVQEFLTLLKLFNSSALLQCCLSHTAILTELGELQSTEERTDVEKVKTLAQKMQEYKAMERPKMATPETAATQESSVQPQHFFAAALNAFIDKADVGRIHLAADAFLNGLLLSPNLARLTTDVIITLEEHASQLTPLAAACVATSRSVQRLQATVQRINDDKPVGMIDLTKVLNAAVETHKAVSTQEGYKSAHAIALAEWQRQLTDLDRRWALADAREFLNSHENLKEQVVQFTFSGEFSWLYSFAEDVDRSATFKRMELFVTGIPSAMSALQQLTNQMALIAAWAPTESIAQIHTASNDKEQIEKVARQVSVVLGTMLIANILAAEKNTNLAAKKLVKAKNYITVTLESDVEALDPSLVKRMNAVISGVKGDASETATTSTASTADTDAHAQPKKRLRYRK